VKANETKNKKNQKGFGKETRKRKGDVEAIKQIYQDKKC